MRMPLPSEQWSRVKEIFDAATDLPVGERTAFLARACQGDEAVRKEVESLLASDEQANSFIEDPGAAIPRDLLAEGKAEEGFAGRQFGSYRIVREIGRGGLGAVYLAARADEQYQKQVAIKLIKRGLDTDDVLRRFRGERQILAQLDHPNIARLIDAGSTEEGLPYFVMEYVEGLPISSYCDAHKLATTERLQLFRSVCSAVTYAHQHLVIHRDIKPSNILVTEGGSPKLLDFGIAKVLHTEDPLAAQTLTGVRIMTPEYASPEQVRGLAISTSTDIYSLGVLLYELLTGQRPYRLTSRTPEEISRAVTDQIPERPSTAVLKNLKFEISNPKSLKGDLDNIVLMALRKEPPRRYSSVAQFSEDIRRHLEGLPVLAHQDTLSYRTSKFVKRHKAGVLAAALVFATLVAGIITTAREKRRAERRFNDVRQLSNALLFEIAPKIERLEGSTDAREALVRRALEYLDSLGQESGDDAQLQGELAAAYEKVGEIQGAPRKPNLSDFSGALASYAKANRIRRRLLERNPNDFAQRQRLAANFAASSFIREWTSEITGALEESKKALEIYEKLGAERPESLELGLATAEAQLDLATIHYFNDQLPKVYPPLQRALASLEKFLETNPGHTEVLRLLGRAHCDLAMTLFWDGKQKEGEAEMEKAFAINKPLAASQPRDNMLRQALLYNYLQASQFFEDDNPAHSFEILHEALSVAQESVANDAANLQARQNLAKTYEMLGVIAVRLQKFDDALSHLEKSFAAFAALEKLDPKNRTYKHDIGRVLMYLGQVQHNRKNFADALTSYEKAVALFADDAQADPKNLFPVRKLALVHSYMGETHDAAAKTASEPEREAHLQAAKENYRRALDDLLQMKSQGAFTTKDREFFEQVQAAVARREE
jgi:serine/threonine protein kinase